MLATIIRKQPRKTEKNNNIRRETVDKCYNIIKILTKLIYIVNFGFKR